MSVITAEGLCASREGRRAFSNVRFSVERGDWLCVLGGSGAGKSTLIGCLTGMVKPDSGKIAYGEGLRPSSIGYMPQTSDAQPVFPATVAEIVRSGLMAKKRAFLRFGAGDKKLAEEAMRALGISELADRRFRDLSGGQRQRVLLARTLVASGSLMALDEPTTGLDAVAASELFDTVKRIHESGVTVVMAVNDERAALRYATHILLLREGAPFFGTAREYSRALNVSSPA